MTSRRKLDKISVPNVSSPKKSSSVCKRLDDALELSEGTATIVSPVASPKKTCEEIVVEFTPQVVDFEEVDGVSVDQILIASRYQIVDRIFIRTPEGKYQGDYIKAINPKGLLVLVRMDIVASLSVQTKNLRSVSEAMCDIPQSMKMRSLECSGSECVGICFEVKGVYCVLNRTRSGDITEFHYKLVGEAGTVSIDGVSVPYPIINLTDIRDHCEETNLIVMKATTSLQKLIMTERCGKFVEMTNLVKRLHDEIVNLNNQTCKIYQARDQELAILYSNYEYLHSKELRIPLCEADRNMIESIGNECHIRNNLLHEINRTLTHYQTSIERLTDIYRQTKEAEVYIWFRCKNSLDISTSGGSGIFDSKSIGMSDEFNKLDNIQIKEKLLTMGYIV